MRDDPRYLAAWPLRARRDLSERAAVTSLRRLLEPAVPPIEVELRVEPATTVAAVRATIDLDEANAWYGGAMDEIDRALRAGGPDHRSAHRRFVGQVMAVCRPG